MHIICIQTLYIYINIACKDLHSIYLAHVLNIISHPCNMKLIPILWFGIYHTSPKYTMASVG